MTTVIIGDGNLGGAIAAALTARGERPRVLGRPAGARHAPGDLAGADLAFDASRGDAVLDNLRAGLRAGCRRFVVATTGWDATRSVVDEILHAHDAAAVVAANFSVGVALFMQLVETATGLFGGFDAFDPYIVEWHRRDKPDRPSGTARELARRVCGAHPAKSRVALDDRPHAPDDLVVVSLRAGASPGMHLVGFDSPGESLELRLTARDRSAYVSGALLAADWLTTERRPAGIHPFTAVMDDHAIRSTASADRGRLATAAT
jgi:4-hydroxy-tetrahydrodipicolinate reductase